MLHTNLSRLKRLELEGKITNEERNVLKDRLLSPNNSERTEVEAAFSAWISNNDSALLVSLKALVTSYQYEDRKQQEEENEEEEQEVTLEELLFERKRATATPPLSSLTGIVHNQTVLFHAKEMFAVAKSAAIRGKGKLFLGEIIWERFDTDDGWPKIFVKNSHDLQFNDVMFLASFHSPQVIFEQLSAIYALARYGCRSLRVIVPFFATGTMERVDKMGEVATAATLARMISITPLCAGGPAQFVFLDIHALQEQFYFTDQVIVLLKSCIRLLLEQLQILKKERNENVVIVFPDDGAFKRFHNKFANYNTVICHKLRLSNDERIVEIRDGLEYVKGSHCVIVDDLVKSGGTLIECADVLQKNHALKVSCYVTHGVFPNESYKKFCYSSNPRFKFDTFWMTDTIPNIAAILQKEKPFKILSISPLIPYLRQNFWDTEPSRYD